MAVTPSGRLELERLLRRVPPEGQLAVLRHLDLDYARGVMDRLAAVGSGPLGFRPAGSAAGRRAAELLLREMRDIGLADAYLEEFPVDGWEFAGAELEVEGGAGGPERLPASSYGGAAGTGGEGVAGPLLHVGLGTEEDYARVDARGAVVLAAIDYERNPWPGIALRQARHHGAAALVLYTVAGFAQQPGALHCFDLQGPADVPVINIARADGERLAARLAAGERLRARVRSTARLLPGAAGRNVVGVIPGSAHPERLILIGDHFDAWFTGYVDDASGVAACLAIARAVLASGYRPRHTLVFVLHDAEEYGRSDILYDWCAGAEAQIRRHPDWAGRTVAALVVELCGFRGSTRLEWYVTPELATFAESVLGDLVLEPWFPEGFRVTRRPTSWEDTWPYAARGIPTLANLEVPEAFRAYRYHTPFDAPDAFDPERYAVHVLAMALAALRLDAAEVPPLDLTRTAADVRAAVRREVLERAGAPVGELLRLLDALEGEARRVGLAGGGGEAGAAGSRGGAPTAPAVLGCVRALNEALIRLGGHTGDATVYPFEQAQADCAALEEAVRRLDAGDPPGALQALRQVAGMAWGADFAYPAYREHLFATLDRPERDYAWGSGRTVPFVDVWEEAQALRRLAAGTGGAGEAAAVRGRLERKLAEARAHARAAVAETCGALRRALAYLR